MGRAFLAPRMLAAIRAAVATLGDDVLLVAVIFNRERVRAHAELPRGLDEVPTRSGLLCDAAGFQRACEFDGLVREDEALGSALEVLVEDANGNLLLVDHVEGIQDVDKAKARCGMGE